MSENVEPYRLHGVLTAWTERRRIIRERVLSGPLTGDVVDRTLRFIDCPCGATLRRPDEATLEFHFLHCPHSRPRTTPDSETSEPEPER